MEEPSLDIREPSVPEQECQIVRCHGSLMRRIVIEGRSSNRKIGRVRRFEDYGSTRHQSSEDFVDELDERVGFDVFDHVQRSDGSQAFVRQRGEVFERVSQGDVEAYVDSTLDSLRIAVDASARDPRLAQHRQEISAARSDVENDFGRSFEVLEVTEVVPETVTSKPVEYSEPEVAPEVIAEEVVEKPRISEKAPQRPKRAAPVFEKPQPQRKETYRLVTFVSTLRALIVTFAAAVIVGTIFMWWTLLATLLLN